MNKKNLISKKGNIFKNTKYKQNGYIYPNHSIKYNYQNNPFRNNAPFKNNIYINSNYLTNINNNFSVKSKCENKVQFNINNILTPSPLQQNQINNKISSQYLPNTYQDLSNYPSFTTNQSFQNIESLYKNNNNPILNSNDLFIMPNELLNINQKINEQNINLIYSNNNKLIKENKNFFDKIIINNNEKNNLEYYNTNTINCPSNFNCNKEKENRRKKKNKFDTNNKNNENENVVILILKLKIGKNDYRYFKLKKFDNVFESIEKFFDMNKIDQKLTKPIIGEIFHALNFVFYIINNKIGKYDQKYLNSLYKLWLKNNKEIPKNFSDKSTTSSSHSSHSNHSSNHSSYEDIKSKSYQNSDGNSSDEKREKTSKSF